PGGRLPRGGPPEQEGDEALRGTPSAVQHPPQTRNHHQTPDTPAARKLRLATRLTTLTLTGSPCVAGVTATAVPPEGLPPHPRTPPSRGGRPPAPSRRPAARPPRSSPAPAPRPAAPAAPDVPRAADPRLVVERFAGAPDVVHPVALDVDAKGRVLVIESHTHFP